MNKENFQVFNITLKLKKVPIDSTFNNQPLLHIACQYGQLSIVQYLISKGASPISINSNHETPLHIAALFCKLDIVQYLIEHVGVDSNIRGWKGRTPLHCACSNDHFTIVQYLVEKAHVDINAVDSSGDAALHIAAADDSYEIVEYLVNHHANLTIKNNQGLSPKDVAESSNAEASWGYLVF